jgi:hypothetical protein
MDDRDVTAGIEEDAAADLPVPEAQARNVVGGGTGLPSKDETVTSSLVQQQEAIKEISKAIDSLII